MAEPDHEQHAKPEEQASSGPAPRWPWVAAGTVVIAAVAGVLWMIYAPRPNVWTNDAYVRVHYATIAPRVSGQVTAVDTDNDKLVKVGDALVRLDDHDYAVAVASAAAALGRDQAMLADAKSTLVRQGAAIALARAQVDASSTQLAYAEADVDRAEQLAETGAGAVKTRQQADTALLQGRSSLDQARATLQSQKDQSKVLAALVDAAAATVGVDQAALDRAKLELSYTRIVAPIDGMVAERSVQVGNYVGPGAGLMVVVPLQDVYIEANYLESQLEHVRAGQAVKIHIDAYDIDLNGTVVGVPAGTGSTFAAIPSDNATGNFTKIVQRLPVEIRVAPNQPLAKLLRVGLSVETTIATGLADVVGAQRTSSAGITSETGRGR